MRGVLQFAKSLRLSCSVKFCGSDGQLIKKEFQDTFHIIQDINLCSAILISCTAVPNNCSRALSLCKQNPQLSESQGCLLFSLENWKNEGKKMLGFISAIFCDLCFHALLNILGVCLFKKYIKT